MRKKYIFGKKLYISILTMIVVLLTTVATTFAWVGVFANSTFDKFDISIKASNLEEYGIELSLTGEEGSFSDSISSIELKKQVLLNWGYSEDRLYNNEVIEQLFSFLEMDQCTTLPNLVGNKIVSLGDFYDIYGEKTNSLFKFDIYISTTKFYDSGQDDSLFALDVFLNQDVMVGNKKKRELVNSYKYPENFTNPYISMIENSLISLPDGCRPVSGGERITAANIDSSTATRVAFEKYKVVDKYDVNAYTSTDTPLSAVIYQKGYDYPVYYEQDDLYNFGGILPDDTNMAIGYYNSTESQYMSHGYKRISIPSTMYQTRGVESATKDISISKETNHLIDGNNSNEKIQLNKMMKMTIYFWFEGWDADCFKSIAGSPVTLKIEFSSKNE